jgi:Coatomer (COPI) alpha subunit C-terminus
LHNRAEGNELKELLDISREYITAIRIKTAAAEEQAPARSMELSAYFTHCNLQVCVTTVRLRVLCRHALDVAFSGTSADCSSLRLPLLCFADCDICQPSHLLLALRMAMGTAFKSKVSQCCIYHERMTACHV